MGEKLLRILDRLRGFYLPFGLFAVVAVGIHAGGDRVDDLAFVLYNRIDAIADASISGLLGFLGELFGVSAKRLDAAVFWAIDFIDLERKSLLARFTALVVELGADVILALPVFLGRREDHTLQRVWLHVRRDPTILRIVAPLDAGMAAISGILVIAREAQAGAFATFDRLLPASTSASLASFAATIALFLVALRLALPVVLAAARWADLQAEQDAIDGRSIAERRRRGWLTALIALPVTWLAVFEATPLLGTLKAIFGG
jgi:hypothetical protein